MSDTEHGVAHHGAPILTERDVDLLMTMVEWIEIARKHGAGSGGSDWLPTHADIIKSRLFWRLRSGKQPLPHPPPRCYSCPWYEVVEQDIPHWVHDGWAVPNHEHLWSFGQCTYDVVETNDAGLPSRVKFGPYVFRCWQQPHERIPDLIGWCLQIDKAETGPL